MDQDSAFVEKTQSVQVTDWGFPVAIFDLLDLPSSLGCVNEIGDLMDPAGFLGLLQSLGSARVGGMAEDPRAEKLLVPGREAISPVRMCSRTGPGR